MTVAAISEKIQTCSYEELRNQLILAAEDAKNGNVMACEEVHNRLEEKYFGYAIIC